MGSLIKGGETMRWIWVNILFFSVGAISQSFGQLVQEKLTESQLAQLLSNAQTFNNAIDWIRSSEESRIPMLLRLTKGIDTERNECSPLSFGLMRALGALKVRQAIPYLKENVACNIYKADNPWLKSPEIIEQRMPALAALISMGSDATKPLIDLYQHPVHRDDRIIAIFGLSRIHDPMTYEFLNDVLGKAQLIEFYAKQGIRAIDQSK